MEKISMDSKDSAIKAALKDADRKGRLNVVSAVTGYSVAELKRIMNPAEPLTLMERSALGIHLA